MEKANEFINSELTILNDVRSLFKNANELKKQVESTYFKRPDLIKKIKMTESEKKLLAQVKIEKKEK